MIAEVGLLSGATALQAHTKDTIKPASNTANAAVDAAAFLTLSQALIGYSDLSQETAARISTAMPNSVADFSAHIAHLTGLMHTGLHTKALLAATSDNPALHATALAIIAAWYTGTIGSGSKAVVVSYAEALMYRPVIDALPVPTYCSFGPLWWTSQPPSPDALPARSTPTA